MDGVRGPIENSEDHSVVVRDAMPSNPRIKAACRNETIGDLAEMLTAEATSTRKNDNTTTAFVDPVKVDRNRRCQRNQNAPAQTANSSALTATCHLMIRPSA